MSARFRIAIPARYGSSRFPGKPLIPLRGRPMIEHVWRRACATGADEVIVATDDERIARTAEAFGARVCLTAGDHASGTDRLAEVVARMEWDDRDAVVNLQGDEPLIPSSLLVQVAEALRRSPNAAMMTLMTPIEAENATDPNLVKVVTDRHGRALSFSRAAIPHQRDPATAPSWLYRRHIGIYGYRAGFLSTYTTLSPAPIERSEQLEQLRALWHGYAIGVVEADQVPEVGVDVPEDVERVEAALAGDATAGPE
jgi:3-deoxy-manno-octulosonate cytidylyltransferase (CMP-KDO synthetase)